MLQQIPASMRYAHPSFVNKLNYNNRHARFFELVNTIPKHDVLFDECAINQNLQSKNVYFWSNKNQISTQNWNKLLCVMIWTSV
jgi:hypothetical protein